VSTTKGADHAACFLTVIFYEIILSALGNDFRVLLLVYFLKE
jgi:hypothetical protein